MVSSVTVTDDRIENYLARLDNALAGISSAEKREILREIRAHIIDSLAGTANRAEASERICGLLGPPDVLAEHYRTEALLDRAGASFSPWLLLRTSWRWAKLGIRGVAAFMLGLTGYGIALAFTVTVLLKPLMPARVGMWVGPGVVQFGARSNPSGVHEVLGQWYIPVATVVAFGFAVGTTHALRLLIRQRVPHDLPGKRPGRR